MPETPRPPAEGHCWPCTLARALWTPVAVLFEIARPRSFKRGDRVLFVVFWELVVLAVWVALR